jgi:uncharacterized protein (DUF58 family)
MTDAGGLRGLFRRWIEGRLPLSDSISLTQRTVYILPTGPGFMLAATLLLLLLTSINYQLNLGYLMTFLLAGSAIVGMHVGHGTLRGLSLSLLPPEPQFAGASALVSVSLQSERRTVRHGIGVAFMGSAQWAWTDVPALGSATLHLAFALKRRGLQRVPTITAETRFPLGSFRVWTVWRPAAQVLVYPAPEASAPPLPNGAPRADGATTPHAASHGDYDGVRAYRRGDPLKLIVWKKMAKSDELVSRDAQHLQHSELWLDSRNCGITEPEHQLSRLCAWVLQAEQQGLDYGLRLPGLEIKPGRGPAHKLRCLEALALC